VNVLSRNAVLAAVQRARALGGSNDEAIASAACALALPEDLVYEVVETAAQLEQAGAEETTP
jgi:hypothetical protein